MPIDFRCEGCGARLRVADEFAGRLARCGKCPATTRVPVPAAPPPAAPPPADVPMALPVVETPPALEPPVAPPAPGAPAVPRARPVAPPTAAAAEQGSPPPAPPSRAAAKITGTPRKRAPGTPRAPRARPAGSSRLTKVLIGVGLVLTALTAVGAYGGWRLLNRPAQWQWHESAQGGFKVELPAAPRDNIAELTGFPTQADMKIEGTVRRGREFFIIYSEFPGGRNHQVTDDQIIDATINGLRTEFKDGSVTAGEPVQVGHFKGRDALVDVPGTGTYTMRVVVTDTRLYLICAGGRSASIDDPDARRFIDSFQVTDPKANSIREERAATARRAREEAERLAEEKRKQAEAEATRLAEIRRREQEAAEAARVERERKRKEAEAAATRFVARQPELSAPDPKQVEGLKLYLSFDDVKDDVVPLWPKESVKLPKELSTAPGVRGDALYFSAKAGGLAVPARLLPESTIHGAYTIAGWVKTKSPYGVDLIRISGPYNGHSTGVLRRARQEFSAYSRIDPEGTERYPGESANGQLSSPCPDDERWHHIALTREGKRTWLYIDGEVSVTFDFNVGRQQPIGQLQLGLLTGIEWQPRPTPHPNGFPDLPVAAADEICIFERAISRHEVRYLAGKVKSAARVSSVKLVEETRIEAVAGVAFDIERKTVWGISAFVGYWSGPAPRVPGVGKEPAYLLRYSYPDFKLTGKWKLRGYQVGNFNYEQYGSAPVLDLKNNWLYAAIDHTEPRPSCLQQEAKRSGTYYRINLNDLPPWKPEGIVPRVRYMDALNLRPQDSPGYATVSPDGAWFYYTSGSSVYRIRPDFLGGSEAIRIPGLFNSGDPLWLTPDGKTLRVFQPVKNANTLTSGLLEIDTRKWASLPLKDIPDTKWSSSAPVPAITVHPDGRVFLGNHAGLIEATYTEDGIKRRVRPVPLASNVFLATTPDGRYLFTSDSGTRQNRFMVLDARANPTQLDELALLTETDKLHVGGPMFVSPDGQFVVFRSGVVVRVDDGTVIPIKDRLALAPMPRVKDTAAQVAPHPQVRPKPPGDTPASPTEFKGLQLYLDFDEYDGTAVTDRVSKRFVGKLNQPQLIDGPRGRALRLASVGFGRPDLAPSGLELEPELVHVGEEKPFTLAFWIRVNAPASPDGVLALVEGEGWRKRTQWFRFDIRALRDKFYLDIEDSPSRVVAPSKSLNPEEWVHVAITRDTKNQLRFYTNGEEVPTTKPVFYIASLDFKRFRAVLALSGQYVVDIDEFCLFDRSLAGEELARLARFVRPRPQARPKPEVQAAPMPHPRTGNRVRTPADIRGLRFHLDFDEYDGTALPERVSGQFVGTVKQPQLVPGARGKGLRLTTSYDRAKLGPVPGMDLDPELLRVGAEKPFTFALWVRRPVGPFLASASSILQAEGFTAGKMDRQLSIYYDSPRITCRVGVRPPELVILASDTVRTEEWVHIALTRDERNEIWLFVNGESAKAASPRLFPHPLEFSSFRLVTDRSFGSSLEVDDFCVFDRALTRGEVQELARPRPKVTKATSRTSAAPMPRESSPHPAGPWVRPPAPPSLATPPAAADFKGLLFYLDCDKLDDDKLIDAVSKKSAGKLNKPVLIDGIRGKAIRLTSEQLPKVGRVAGLTLEKGAIGVDADKPFTIAFWGRLPAHRIGNNVAPRLFEGHTEQKTQQGTPESLTISYSRDDKLGFSLFKYPHSVFEAVPLPEVEEWSHVVIRRDEKNEIRFFFNGKEILPRKQTAFPGPIRYETFKLVYARAGRYTMDIDEFCFFDRALTVEEIKKLAGRASK